MHSTSSIASALRRLVVAVLAASVVSAVPADGAEAGPEPGSEEARGGKFSVTIDPRLPNVLILGDSISMGYLKPLQGLLKGRANVIHPPENCQSTATGLARIDAWLGATSWSVIHFNFGLHDLKHVSDRATGQPSSSAKDPRWVDPETYGANLQKIVDRLEASGAKLVFATTTPVPALSSTGGIYRASADVPLYNELAKAIMAKNHIAIDDLYAFAEPRAGELQKRNNVHFTDQGSRELADRVSQAIRSLLDAGKP